jgi:hypothetical protein
MGETLKDARAQVIGAADVRAAVDAASDDDGKFPADVPTRNGG